MQEKTTYTEKNLARGQVKAMVIKKGDQAEQMVELSVHDTKPVYFISAAVFSLKWMNKRS